MTSHTFLDILFVQKWSFYFYILFDVLLSSLFVCMYIRFNLLGIKKKLKKIKKKTSGQHMELHKSALNTDVFLMSFWKHTVPST